MEYVDNQIRDLGLLLIDIGSILISSGASTDRTRKTVNRISGAYGFQTDMFITHRAIMLTVHGTVHEQTYSIVKRTNPHLVNFKIVSGISRMSWKVVEENWDLNKIRDEINRLISLPPYHRWLVTLMIGLAGASFCRLFGGGIIEMLVALVATSAGFIIRHVATKRKYNPYLCVYFAALTASLISGLSVKLNIGVSPELAFATSVLFLIPGVPLINAFSDIIDGNPMNAIIRAINGLTIAFAIALGLLTAMIVYQL